MTPSKTQWDCGDIPDLRGRVAVVTGPTSGIGKEAARALAEKHASVVLAVRNESKGQAVADEFRAECADADVSVRVLDLADLHSIGAFAQSILTDFDRLDLLVNNAGIMMCPYARTRDGFEIQFGTNHLGHFSLTGQLLPLLTKTSGSRVVIVSSLAHRRGKLDFSDLNWTSRKYVTTQAYMDSKLANVYFAYELANLLSDHGDNPTVTIAHPGWTATELQRHKKSLALLNHFLGQNAAMGALPTLRAALDDTALPGDFFGPGKHFEMHGYPVKVESTPAARDRETARELWRVSQEMTGVMYYL